MLFGTDYLIVDVYAFAAHVNLGWGARKRLMKGVQEWCPTALVACTICSRKCTMPLPTYTPDGVS